MFDQIERPPWRGFAEPPPCTILNLYCSPARRWDIVAGKALPYLAVSFLDYLLIFAASLWIFRVRFVGSVWVLSAGALLYAVCTVGIGLLISALTRSQLAAMLATFLGTVAPAFTFSGIFAPAASQDAVGRIVSRLRLAGHRRNPPARRRPVRHLGPSFRAARQVRRRPCFAWSPGSARGRQAALPDRARGPDPTKPPPVRPDLGGGRRASAAAHNRAVQTAPLDGSRV